MALVLSGTLALTPREAASAQLPRIGWRNHLHDGAVSASSEQPNHAALLAADRFTDTAWIGAEGEGSWWLRLDKPGASVDYAGILLWSAGVTVRLQYSDDDGETWTDQTDPVMSVDRVVVFLFDRAVHDHWRFYFEGGTAPEVAYAALGEVTVLPRGLPVGFQPPRQARDNVISNNTTEQGHLVGRSVLRRGIRTSLTLSYVDEAWVREEWEPLVDHLELGPAFFVWSPLRWPNESALIWVDGDIRPPRYDHVTGLMSVSLNLQGFAR